MPRSSPDSTSGRSPDSPDREGRLTPHCCGSGRSCEPMTAGPARRCSPISPVTLAGLRAFAIERSAFYHDLYRGLERAPLSELPVDQGIDDGAL